METYQEPFASLETYKRSAKTRPGFKMKDSWGFPVLPFYQTFWQLNNIFEMLGIPPSKSLILVAMLSPARQSIELSQSLADGYSRNRQENTLLLKEQLLTTGQLDGRLTICRVSMGRLLPNCLCQSCSVSVGRGIDDRNARLRGLLHLRRCPLQI
jgi:hypothetical protein